MGDKLPKLTKEKLQELARLCAEYDSCENQLSDLQEIVDNVSLFQLAVTHGYEQVEGKEGEFHRKKLIEFADAYGYDAENHYKLILSNPKILHKYICFCQIDPIRKIEVKEFGKNVEKETVLVENRKLPHIEFLIRNAIAKLSDEWNHTVVCTGDNYEYVLNICNSISEKIRIVKLDIDDMDQKNYNDLLLSVEFWKTFHGEKLLVYQQDAIIFHGEIEKFMEYDYIGAPWPMDQDDNKLGVGNGGFSLRSKSKLIKCLQKVKPEDLELNASTLKYMTGLEYQLRGLGLPPEDVYFSKTMIDYNLGKVAEFEVAREFSQESIKSENPLGGHQYWIADLTALFTTFNTYKMIDWSYFIGEATQHRGGWKHVVNSLVQSHIVSKTGSVILLDIVEKYFLWDNNAPLQEDWVGILHITPNAPEYLDVISVDKLFENENFVNSLKYCKHLVVMSNYLKNYIEKLNPSVNVKVVKHPIGCTNIKKFNFNTFKQKKDWNVIQLGQQMRYLSTIYRLKTSFKKMWMPGFLDFDKMNGILDDEIKWLNVDINREEVAMRYTKSFKEYDTLITENIIVINLIDASANNSILELMSSNTPFFVNKLDPVVEYLGEDFPMYYDDIGEVEKILESRDKLLDLYRKTHLYLKDLDKRDISLQNFNSEMLGIIN